MAGYLIAEEGPLAGLVISFDEGTEWILGRDPDEASIVLEDPMVSRKHVICHLTTEGLTLENLSSVNPATQNGRVITEEVLLKEGDILEIGTTFFRFSEKNPAALEEIEESPVFEERENLPSINFDLPPPTRWLLKVISGPNTGAEFNLTPSASYILGKDPHLCDVVFQDLSVSKEHARIEVNELEEVVIEDLNSKNGVLVNSIPITGRQLIAPQDLVALGTTSFLLIDREQAHETIIAPPLGIFAPKTEEREETPSEAPVATTPLLEKDWKEMKISKTHLWVATASAIFLIGLVSASFSLFRSKPVHIEIKHESEQIKEALHPFPGVQFSFNEPTGKLFLIGHVLTSIEKQEMTYRLSTLSFITSVEDTVIIDELVWQNMNAVLLTNPNWQAISIHSPVPEKFVVKGYVQTPEEAESLSDYLNTQFPYLNLLENQVLIANTLTLQIESILVQKGYKTVEFNLSGGDLTFIGIVDKDKAGEFATLAKDLQKIPGIRSVKNLVTYASQGSGVVDLSSKYRVSGISMGDNDKQFAIINTKIFSPGDLIDGMKITAIDSNLILLEKDGIKFRINYNLQ